jgi:hypothetical protein
MAKQNIVDKVTDDDSKIVITNRSVKWIIGILVGGIISILGFAWGLYVKTDTKIDTKHTEFQSQLKDSETAIIKKMEELDKEKVKPNADKNYAQDMDIVRLYERTNSRDNTINNNGDRPTIINNNTDGPQGPPTIGQ